MAKKYKYTDEEKEIIDYIESGNSKSVPNLKKEIAKYQEAAKKQYSKKRAISIRLLEYDIDKLKAKSIQEGIPYQTLIAGVVHKYANS